MSKDESEQAWVEDASTILSRINEIAEKADSTATIHLRQLVRKLIKAKAKPKQNLIVEFVGEFVGNLWDNYLRNAPDTEFWRIAREADKKFTAETELEEAQLKNDTDAILEKVSVMKPSQLYKVAEDLKNKKTITEIRYLLASDKWAESSKAFDGRP